MKIWCKIHVIINPLIFCFRLISEVTRIFGSEILGFSIELTYNRKFSVFFNAGCSYSISRLCLQVCTAIKGSVGAFFQPFEIGAATRNMVWLLEKALTGNFRVSSVESADFLYKVCVCTISFQGPIPAYFRTNF